MSRVVLLGLVVLPLAGGCGSGDEHGHSGTIEFPDVEVGSLLGGRVLEVLKREGDLAAAGEVLVRLDPEEWEHGLAAARARALSIQRELELLLAGTRPEQVARAQADSRRLELLWNIVAQGARDEELEAAKQHVAEARAGLAEAEAALAREVDLGSDQSSTAEARERAVAARDVAAARAAAAEQRWHLLERGARPEEVEAAWQAWLAQEAVVRDLQAGPRPEEIAAKRAALAAAEAEIRFAETKVDELTIAAPAAAVVQTLDLRPGDLIAPRSPVAVLLLREDPWITIYVPEDQLASVRLGQPAVVAPDGHAPVDGRVTWISREAEFTPRNVQTRRERVTQVFAVRVTLSGDTAKLKDGMWADVDLR